MRTAVSWRGIVLLSLAVPACSAQQPDEEAALTAACMETIANIALANPMTNELAANYVGPLGLTPTSDPTAPPYRTKQAEYHAPGGVAHYFAVERPDWTKVTLMRLTPTASDPRIQLFVTDRTGTLLAAGVIENRKLAVLDIDDAETLREFASEQAVLAANGPPHACASG